MKKLRFAAIGAGFWARFQLHGWQSTGEAECVAICDRNLAKTEALAKELGVPTVYDNAAKMFQAEQLDFVDIISDVNTHAKFVKMAASCGIPVVCQKPMATSLDQAEELVRVCRNANVPFYVNEN